MLDSVAFTFLFCEYSRGATTRQKIRLLCFALLSVLYYDQVLFKYKYSTE
jgi:hypothetical protein